MYSLRFFAIILALFAIAVIAVPPFKYAPSVKGKLAIKAEPESQHDLPATLYDGHGGLRARTFGAVYHPSMDHSSYHYSDSQNKLRAKTSQPKTPSSAKAKTSQPKPPSSAKAKERKPRPVPAAKGKPHLIESKERSRFTPITTDQGVKYKYTIINKPKGFPWQNHPEKVYVKGRWGPSEYKFVGRNHFDDLGYYKPGRFGRRGKLVFVRDPWFFREDFGPKKSWFNKGGKYFQKSSHDRHLDHGLDLNHRRDIEDKDEFGNALKWLNNTKIEDLIDDEKNQDMDLISGLEWLNFTSTAPVPANEEDKDEDIISSIAWFSNNGNATLPIEEEVKDDDFISRLSNDSTATVPAKEEDNVEDFSGLAFLNDTSSAHLSLNDEEDPILNMTSTGPFHADEEKDDDFISGIEWLNETSSAYLPSEEKENNTDTSAYTLPLDESATNEAVESPNDG